MKQVAKSRSVVLDGGKVYVTRLKSLPPLLPKPIRAGKFHTYDLPIEFLANRAELIPEIDAIRGVETKLISFKLW